MWRYNAGGAGANLTTSSATGGFSHSILSPQPALMGQSPTITGAGAFLRQNAAGGGDGRGAAFSPSAALLFNQPTDNGSEKEEDVVAVDVPPSAPKPKLIQSGLESSKSGAYNVGTAQLSRQLFRTAGGKAAGGGGRQFESYEKDNYYEEAFGDLSSADYEFVLNTRDLFEEVDPELLQTTFVPYKHVVGVIASQVTGTESTPAEFDEKLQLYRDLEEDINADLGTYVETHHDTFNQSISDFSEMILAVSGSDDTLAGMKQQLSDAERSLGSHAEQLHALRLRAAKSLFLSETLQSIQDALSVESDVKALLEGRHYLSAVQALLRHQAALRDERVSQVRATLRLRSYVGSTLSTMHTHVIDDLLTCVFRQERLADADVQAVQELMNEHAGIPEASPALGLNSTQQNVQRTVRKYWELHGKSRGSDDAPGSGGGDTAAAAVTPPDSDSLSAIIDTIFDDPTDNTLWRNYLHFVPLCVKALIFLGKLDHCHAAFFSKATRSIEKFIAHFLHLYDAWRRRSSSATTLADSEADPIVRAIRVRAFELTSDTVSMDEAIAQVQSGDLRAMLSALFTELEKTLRNADYLIKTVFVARFPFLSEWVLRPVPFSVADTSEKWEISRYRFIDPAKLTTLAEAALDRAFSRWSRINESMAGQPRQKRTFQKQGVEATQFHRLRDALNIPAHLQGRAAAVSASASAPNGGGTADGDEVVEPVSSTLQWPLGVVTLQDVLEHVADTVAILQGESDSADANGAESEEALSVVHRHVVVHLKIAVRAWLTSEVEALTRQWNLQVLWAQLNYHMEFVFHVLCDAKNPDEDGDDAISLQPFLRQRSVVSRVQRTAAYMRDMERQPSEEGITLDRLLTTYQSSGALRMLEETGTVSFSLTGAVKKSQAEARVLAGAREHANGAQLLASAEAGEKGVGGAGAPLVIMQATALRSWFIFTSMNALTCYMCATRFQARCFDRVPELMVFGQDTSVLGFLCGYLRSTYVPAIHSFHSQQLQQLCQDMSDSSEMTVAAMESVEERIDGGGGKGAGGAGETAAVATTANDGAAKKARKTATWPAVTAVDTPRPVLSCVHYIGRVLRKMAALSRSLPEALANNIERSTSEPLVVELSVFLRRKLQLLGRGTIHYRLLNKSFEDAFTGNLSKLWMVMCNENDLWRAHSLIDRSLYRYYQFSSAQRTSGHEYNAAGAAALDILNALEAGEDGELDERVGALQPQDLCLQDNGSVVALALLSYSAEWLAEVLLRATRREQRIGKGGDGDSGAEGTSTAGMYVESAVPGAHLERLFNRTKLPVARATGSSSSSTARGVAEREMRIGGHLQRLCALSRAALFHLSVEARFLAFLFIPQLRDESYDIIAFSNTADNFVQAYTRRISNLYALLRQHLTTMKIKYTCLTIGKPASELVLLELAHLRDKAISEAGGVKLHTNLLVMQTTLQLILPTDNEVRSAVSRYFSRAALFVRYVFNRDVVNEIIANGDYKYYSSHEIEVLIRLVFRQVSGANDDSLARKHIALYEEKTKAIEARRSSAAGVALGMHDDTASLSNASHSSVLEEDEEGEEEAAAEESNSSESATAAASSSSSMRAAGQQPPIREGIHSGNLVKSTSLTSPLNGAVHRRGNEGARVDAPQSLHPSPPTAAPLASPVTPQGRSSASSAVVTAPAHVDPTAQGRRESFVSRISYASGAQDAAKGVGYVAANDDAGGDEETTSSYVYEEVTEEEEEDYEEVTEEEEESGGENA